MKELNFGKASSFQPATIIKITFAASVFQRFCLAFKNVFFQEQLSFTAFVSPLETFSCILPELIYWKGVLKMFGIFLEKHPCSCVISITITTQLVIAWSWLAGMKSQTVQSGQISPQDYMGKSYFIPSRRDSFHLLFLLICLHFLLIFLLSQAYDFSAFYRNAGFLNFFYR